MPFFFQPLHALDQQAQAFVGIFGHRANLQESCQGNQVARLIAARAGGRKALAG